MKRWIILGDIACAIAILILTICILINLKG